MTTRRTFCVGAFALMGSPLSAASPLTPEQFGARGDGFGDDAPAIQRALDSGQPVRLRAGARYRLLTSLRMPSGSALAGGAGSALLPRDSVAILVEGTSNVSIADLTVIGDRQRYRRSDNHGVFVDWRRRGGSNVTLRRVAVRDVAGSGIIALAGEHSRSRGFTVEACRISSVGAHGIIAQDYVDDVLFEGNEVRGTSLMVADRPGITGSRSGRRVIIRGNRCIGSPDAIGRSVHGISLDDCAEAECSGNHVRGWVHGYGIELGGARSTRVFGNEVKDGRYGIVLSGWTGKFRCEQVLVEDNTITRMSAAGLYSFMGHGPGYHRDVTLRRHEVREVTGPRIGIGAFLTDIDGLEVAELDVRNCSKSGVALIDCINFYLQGVRSIGNNIAGDPAHAGLAIRWLRTPIGARGINTMVDNKISGNWRERNLVYFDR